MHVNVKTLRLEPCPPPWDTVRALIEEHHYLHSLPLVWRTWTVHYGTDVMGAVVFSPGPRMAYRLVRGAKPGEVAELSRLWLADSLPKNSESRVVSVALRLLRRELGVKAVVSYADPSNGHEGTIYRASGWTALGSTNPETFWDLGNGRLTHRRSLYSRYGTQAEGAIRHLCPSAMPVKVPGKYRYLYQYRALEA